MLARREAPKVPEMWTLSSSGNQKQRGLQGEDTGAWSWDSIGGIAAHASPRPRLPAPLTEC